MVSFRFSTTVALSLMMLSFSSVSVYVVGGGGEEDAVDMSLGGSVQQEEENLLQDFVDVEFDVESMEGDVSDGASSLVDGVDVDDGDFDVDVQEQEQEQDSSLRQRRLAHYSYYYNNHKACRRHDGSAGHKDTHYKVYNIPNDWRKCEQYCNEKSWCYAYEYSNHKRCELWKEKPPKLSGYKKNFYCSIKKYGPTPSPPKPTPHPTPYPTYKKPTPHPTTYKKPTSSGKWAYYSGACRAKDGGAGHKGTHWDLHRIGEDECKKICYDKGSYCKAYEWSHNRCEIWHKHPGYYSEKHGYKCVLKKF